MAIVERPALPLPAGSAEELRGIVAWLAEKRRPGATPPPDGVVRQQVHLACLRFCIAMQERDNAPTLKDERARLLALRRAAKALRAALRLPAAVSLWPPLHRKFREASPDGEVIGGGSGALPSNIAVACALAWPEWSSSDNGECVHPLDWLLDAINQAERELQRQARAGAGRGNAYDRLGRPDPGLFLAREAARLLVCCRGPGAAPIAGEAGPVAELLRRLWTYSLGAVPDAVSIEDLAKDGARAERAAPRDIYGSDMTAAPSLPGRNRAKRSR